MLDEPVDAIGTGSQSGFTRTTAPVPTLTMYPDERPQRAVLYGPKGEKLYKPEPKFGYRLED